jgi:hypothetical protein
MILLITTVNNGGNIQEVTQNDSDILDKYAILNPVTELPTSCDVDHYGKTFKPPDCPDEYVPIKCTGNGNCLFNTVSILLCGNEGMAVELRVRTAIALIQLQQEFSNISNRAVRQSIHEQSVLYAPDGVNNHRVNRYIIIDSEIDTIFKCELITTLTNGEWSGMWQILALATALQMPIMSIYPIYNHRRRDLYN